MAKRSNDNIENTSNIGTRIAEVASVLGLNQKTLADRLGVSQGFISSVVNNQAMPGGDFLLALDAEFGVDAAWVLTGKGGMYGEGQIDIPLFKEIRMLVAIARAAVIDEEPTAKAIVILINSDNLENTRHDPSMQAYLNALVAKDCDIDWVIALYNRYLAAYSPKNSRRQVMTDAISHFQLIRPVDLSSSTESDSLKPRQKTVYKGTNVRHISGNYKETNTIIKK